MKILINTASTFKGGSVQVANSFIQECKSIPGHEYYIVLSKELSQIIRKNEYFQNFYFFDLDYRPASRVLSFKSHNTFFKRLEKAIEPDVVFTTSGPAYWKPKAAHLVGYNLGHYLYEDSPFFNIISTRKRLKWKLKGKLLKHYFRRESSAFVVQTEDVNKRLKQWINTSNPIFTVSNTCSSYFRRTPNNTNKIGYRKEKEYRLLVFSAYYKHKNLDIIPEIIDQFTAEELENIKFITTIETGIYNTLFSPRHQKNIVNVGPVKIEEGPSLYKECDALFLPTLLECFTASYPEAMAMRKPIITSDLSFARSICGDAALYFNPIDSNSAASAIRELINNSELQAKLIINGEKRLKSFLTPDGRAKEFIRICENLVNEQVKK